MNPEHEKLKEILVEAAGKATPAERAAYLDVACRGDAALRRQLEALLAAHARAGDFLEKTVELPPSDIVSERTGTMIGRYKLLERIGEGGFGVVFMAEQTEPVTRKVALKIIKAGMDTREVIARFEAERQALALMDHPNIARVLDAGATHTGRPYFVMELVRGIPITDYCDQNNLPTADRLQLFMQVCHAVQHAHQKGIIHRDLKPTNILITRIDGQAVPKVIDFGVAKALGQKLTQKTLFTGFQQMIGTPAYMSPEQAALSGVDVDTRSDIYSLGVLLYELLTGVTPFDQETLHQAALDEIRRMIRETEPPKPSTRLHSLGDKLTEVAKHRHIEPTALARLVHGDLDWIAMKALEKDRARRYGTANDLAMDLERHLEHQPVAAGPPGMVYRARKFIRRHRLGVAVAAAVFFALALGLVVSLIGFAQARHERDRALVAETDAEKQRNRAEHSARQEAEQRQRAEASAEAARVEKEIAGENLQMAQINLIQHHLDKGEVGPALALLEAQRPTVHLEDSRSLEWRHLWWRAHQGHRFTLRGHEGPVYAVAFVPEANLVVSGGADGTVRLWDMAGGAERAIVARNQAIISCLAVSPDAKTLAWGDAEGVLTIWDLSQGRRRTNVWTHNETVANLAFSPDSRFIATGNMDGTTRLWKADSGESAGPALTANADRPSAVAFSPDGQTLACANLDYGSVTLLDLNGLKARARLKNHRFWIKALAFSPDGKTLVTGGNNTTVKLWDVAAAREKAEFTPGVRSPMPLALSPDGTAVAIGGTCGTIEVRNLATGATKTFGHVGEVIAVAFSPDGRTLASAGQDGTVKLWDLTPEQNLPPLHGRQTLVWMVAYSLDGKTLVSASDPDPELWDVSSGRLLQTIPVGGSTSAAFSPDGKVLAIGGNRLWEVEAGRALPPLRKGGLAATFSRDGETFISGGGGRGQDNDIRLWDWRNGRERAALGGHSQWVFSLAVSPDGLTLASASGQGPRMGEVMLWELSTGQRKRTLQYGRGCVAFSPDGRILASGSKSGGIALWDPNTGNLLKDMVGHVSFHEDLAFAPDGKTIIACNVQGGVTLWDVEKGIERAALAKNGHSVYSTAIAPDGRTFATGGREGTLEIWRTATEAEVRAQSDCFDPRLRLARKHHADAWTLQTGLRLPDTLRACSQAETLYQELATEFPDRTDYRFSMLANQNVLVALAADHDSLLAETNRWLRLADSAVEMACRDTNQLSALLRPALLNRFNLLQRLNRLSGAAADKSNARELGEEVLTVMRQVLGPDHPETLRAMQELADAFQTQGNLAEAQKLLEGVLAASRRVMGDEHRDTLRSISRLAWIFREQGKLAEAQQLMEEALATKRRVLKPEDPDTLASMVNLGIVCMDRANLAEAEKLMEEALPAIQRVYGPEHPSALLAMADLAVTYKNQGKVAEAQKLEEEALLIQRRVLGAEDPGILITMSNLAITYRKQGKLAEALKLEEEVLAAQRRILGPEHRDTISAMNNLAWAMATCADAKVRNGDRALRLAQEAVAATGRTNATYLDTLAAAYAEVGQFAEAVNVQQAAIAVLTNAGWKEGFASRLRLYEGGYRAWETEKKSAAPPP